MPLASVHSHDQHTHRLLSEIEAGQDLSQRSLARNLGIALGLTNLLVRRLVRKGWVRMIHIKPNRVSYLLTPTGIVEKARMSRDSLQYSVRFYAEARERIRDRFAELSAEWPSNNGSSEKRIVFLRTGEVAEIGYVCLQETDLQLVAAINDHGPSTGSSSCRSRARKRSIGSSRRSDYLASRCSGSERLSMKVPLLTAIA